MFFKKPIITYSPKTFIGEIAFLFLIKDLKIEHFFKKVQNMFRKGFKIIKEGQTSFFDEFNEIIADLEDNQKQRILEIYKEKLPHDFNGAIKEIQEEIGLEANKVWDLTYSAISSYLTYFHSGKLLEDFLKKIKNDKTREFLKELLKMDKSIGIISKIIYLENESPNIFIKTNLITDLRPIYFNDPLVETQNGVIKHTLSITIEESGILKNIYITLNHNDLKELSRVIERGLNKEKTLEESCRNKNFKLFRGFEVINE